MITNKEKRLSKAYEGFTNPILEEPPPPPPPNHGPSLGNATNHLSSYGMINNNHIIPSNSNNGSHNGSNGSGNRDVLLGNKMHLNDRNSHSLQHDFSQMYISNLKSHMRPNKNHSFTQGKRHDRYDGPVLPTLEELNSYKREANEVKKQMMQMEKSITFYCDSTEYWRTKWRKTRDEKIQSRNEVKQLKSKLSRLEQQLRSSEDKRARLAEEVNVLHSELSKFMYKFDTESDGRHRTKQLNSNVHYNSDRKVDYRKQRRKKEIINKRNDMSSTEEDEFQRLDHLRSAEIFLPKASFHRHKDANLNSLPSTSGTNPKVVLRNHDRLFDKKIIDRKRFSQVVMCDEEEIFQFNQEIPSNSLSKNGSDNNNTLKHRENNAASNGNSNPTANESLNESNTNFQQRYMDHVSEEEEEEGFAGPDEEDDASDRFRRRHKQFLLDDSANGGGKLNHSNISTMATNSECANAGSIRTDDVDEDSFRSDQPDQGVHIQRQKDDTLAGVGNADLVAIDDDDEDDEV